MVSSCFSAWPIHSSFSGTLGQAERIMRKIKICSSPTLKITHIKLVRHKLSDIRQVYGDVEAMAPPAAVIKGWLAISNVTVP